MASETPDWLTPDPHDEGSSKKPMEMETGVDETPPVTAPEESAPTSSAEAASRTTWREFFRGTIKRDGRLVLITILILVLMQIPFVQWALYPFTIFSTWIHELCHGFAAIMAGGSIKKLEIFPDTSGLATTYVRSDRRGFVASAGYQGTAVIGCLLLLVRRTKRGPRSGTMAVAVMMILSVCLWIRNAFGVCFMLGFGLLLGVAAWKLSSDHIRSLYVCMAVTCALNAIASARYLYGNSHMVNGQASGTDAHTMAEIKGGSVFIWATIWLVLALVMMICGILFAIPGPDEVADFTVCGTCQDCGLFGICNFQGLRLFEKFFGKKEEKKDSTDDVQVSDTV